MGVILFGVFQVPQAFECGKDYRFFGKAGMYWRLLTLPIVAHKKTKAAVPAALKSLRQRDQINHTRPNAPYGISWQLTEI